MQLALTTSTQDATPARLKKTTIMDKRIGQQGPQQSQSSLEVIKHGWERFIKEQ